MKKYGDGRHGVLPIALGGASSGMSLVVLGMLTYFLTTQTGLSGTVVGTILLCSRIFDGISDLLVGYLIDRCHFKLGKARPFDLFAIPMWIALVLCFAVPGLHTAGKIIYVFVMYNLCQTVCYTFTSVAGTVRLKRTFIEEKRSGAVAATGLLTAVFATAAGIILPILIDNLENEPNGWIIITGVFAIPGILMSLCMFFFAPEMKPTEEQEKAGKVSFKEFISELVKNKYLLMIIIIVLAGTLTSGINGNVSTFFFKYVFGDLTIASMLGVVSMIAYVFLALIPVMTKRLGNRAVMMVSFAFIIAGNLAKYLNPKSVGWLALCTVLAMAGTTLCVSVSSLVLIDTMNYGKLKTGRENEGVYSAIRGFADKVANGIAPFIVGRVLDMGGFDGTLEVQSAGANAAIFTVYALVPALIGAIGFITMFLCRMEKEMKQLEG